MRIGYTTIFQGSGDPAEDARVYADEIRLCDLAEPLGFEMLWATEHHFTSYTMSPDPVQFLTYMAGRTKDIQLGAGAVILPWHDPIRVAESVSVLDVVSDGRFILGLGRGLGRIEFEGMGIPMDEARPRFVEAAQIVLEALESGVLEADGEYYKIPRRELRPRSGRGFKDRLYAAAVSAESIQIMAELGAGILINPQKSWDAVAADLRTYRDQYRSIHQAEAPAPMVSGWVICDQDPVRARDLAQEYIGAYFESVMSHYEMGGRHFETTQGYEYYKRLASYIGKKGEDQVVSEFVELQVFGTPDECFDRVMDIRSKVGNDTLNVVCSFSGMPAEMAEANMRLFASEVMPRLKEVPDLDPSELDAVVATS
jgi:alkanesulfonate monooxygenase SsuD/methylene tetrahydromethanopterin reductase-like flavin-dependent oxidoreductase (luciferase family)